MKPPPFSYAAPREREEALALLAAHGDDAKVLAGGQSLIPMLNLRLARPAVLVDVTRVSGLGGVRRRDGRLRIGATTRQADLLASRAANDGWPLLAAALRHLAHPQIRNRGTVGGSVAHADPAAELPAVLMALRATFHVASHARPDRAVAADDFFLTHFTTVLEPDELLVEVDVPPWPERAGWGFAELARRQGDFALAGAAVLVRGAPDATCAEASAVLLAAGATPVRAEAAERLVAGGRLDAALAAEAAREAMRDLEPTGDLHGSTDFRRAVLERQLRDALTAAGRRLEARAAA